MNQQASYFEMNSDRTDATNYIVRYLYHNVQECHEWENKFKYIRQWQYPTLPTFSNTCSLLTKTAKHKERMNC